MTRPISSTRSGLRTGTDNPSLFGDPFFSDSVWQNARIHQFRGGHDENWGGDTINIDNDQVGGPTG